MKRGFIAIVLLIFLLFTYSAIAKWPPERAVGDQSIPDVTATPQPGDIAALGDDVRQPAHFAPRTVCRP